MNREEAGIVWAMFYAGLMGMAQHPGFQREGTHKSTPERCAEMADAMLREYNVRFGRSNGD